MTVQSHSKRTFYRKTSIYPIIKRHLISQCVKSLHACTEAFCIYVQLGDELKEKPRKGHCLQSLHIDVQLDWDGDLTLEYMIDIIFIITEPFGEPVRSLDRAFTIFHDSQNQFNNLKSPFTHQHICYTTGCQSLYGTSSLKNKTHSQHFSSSCSQNESNFNRNCEQRHWGRGDSFRSDHWVPNKSWGSSSLISYPVLGHSPVCLLVYIQQQLLLERQQVSCRPFTVWWMGHCGVELCKKDIHTCGNIKNPFLCWLLDRWLKSGKLWLCWVIRGSCVWLTSP